MAAAMDELDSYERYKQEIAPKMRELMERGASTEEIYKFAQSFAAARAVTIALSEVDSSKALAAVKEILDRSQGKAKERTEIEHRYSKMPENELDALLESKLREVADSKPKVQ